MADVEWVVVGERLHAVIGRSRGGNRVHTKCGQLIYLSALDRWMADPPVCQPCYVLALPRPSNPAPGDVRRP
ncbi:hypothetical protein ACFWQL_11700 [Amycolatopsis thermoflava]|uniref:hypothetical protein n=1 Tax=Amycolatopsis thermoflava TaxID=84480 RepID=UPI003659A159